jgi:hypothetical protein
MVQFDASSDGELRDQWRHAGIEEIATGLGSLCRGRGRPASRRRFLVLPAVRVAPQIFRPAG